MLVFQIAKLAHILQKAQALLLQSEKIKFVPLICKQLNWAGVSVDFQVYGSQLYPGYFFPQIKFLIKLPQNIYYSYFSSPSQINVAHNLNAMKKYNTIFCLC